MSKIGLSPQDIKIDLDVYYYPWYDADTNENVEPIKTKITCG